MKPIPEEIEWHEDGADVHPALIVVWLILAVLVFAGVVWLIALQPV